MHTATLRTGVPNRWCPKTVAYRQDFRPHCPLGAHVFLKYWSGRRALGRHHAHTESYLLFTFVLPWSFPGGLAESRPYLPLLLSSSYRRRQGRRFRRNVHSLL